MKEIKVMEETIIKDYRKEALDILDSLTKKYDGYKEALNAIQMTRNDIAVLKDDEMVYRLVLDTEAVLTLYY